MSPKEQDRTILLDRVAMAVLGTAAGVSFWLLVEVLPDTDVHPRLYLAVFALVAVFFGVALALCGPVSILRAVAAALAVAVPSAALLSLAGLRFADAADIARSPPTLMMFIIMVSVATPFLAVWLQDRTGWRRYPDLFDAAWTITVRYLAAWLFVGVAWLVLMLSNALLGLVGVDVIENLLDVEPVPYAFSGLVLGIALAVVHELRSYLSPYLLLRLLRLLLPVVLLVVLIFIAALPLRGLSSLFGDFSAAGTLMGVTIGAITLITIALDRDNGLAVHTPLMRSATQVLALALPILGALALYAIVLRVMQYGWTPDRVFAAVCATFLLAYGVCYAVVALARRHWMDRIRRVNVTLALVLIAIAALWMTPLLYAEKISTGSQIARYQSGQAMAAQLPLWEMDKEWGKAGQRGLARLEELDSDGALAPMIAAAREVDSKYALENLQNVALGQARVADLIKVMPVRPEGETLRASDLAAVHVTVVERWYQACSASLSDQAPSCVLVIGELDETGERQGMFFAQVEGQNAFVELISLGQGDQSWARNMYDLANTQRAFIPDGTVARILSGDFRIGPSRQKALFVGDMELVPDN